MALTVRLNEISSAKILLFKIIEFEPNGSFANVCLEAFASFTSIIQFVP